MRPFVSFLTAVTFVLHLGLGCCAHHTHGSGGNERAIPTPPADVVTHHGHSHGHDHSVPDSNAPEHPGDSHSDCHQNHCTFLVTGKTTIVPDTLVAALLAATPDAVVAQISSSSANWIRDTGDHLQLPVRLHLLKQVMLI